MGGAPGAAPPAQEQPRGDAYCLSCHANTSLTTAYTDGTPLSLYVDARLIRDSAHELLDCVTCHDDYQVLPPELREPIEPDAYREEAAEMCARCHQSAAGGYAASAHSEVEEGKGATCTECHSPDDSSHSVTSTSGSQSVLTPGRVAGTCGRCHSRELNTYDATSHGKVARFGDAGNSATCTTCHGDHALPVAEELVSASGITALAGVCAKCHEGADASFARAWPGHTEGAPSGSMADVAGRAGFFIAAVVVALGLAHVGLDFLRRFADREGGEG